MSTTRVHIRQSTLTETWEEELKCAGFVDSGRWDHEVEDGAEVVGGDEGCFGGPEGDVRSALGDWDHECWVEIAA